MAYIWPQHYKIAPACDGLVTYLTHRRYFFLGSSMLDPEVIWKTHPRLILAFSKAVGLGLSFSFPK